MKRALARSNPLPHPLTPYSELIVNFCPTGMIPTKQMTPHVPIAPAEVVEEACGALERGDRILNNAARRRQKREQRLSGPARKLRQDIGEASFLEIAAHHDVEHGPGWAIA